jgi:hypothetical protein
MPIIVMPWPKPEKRLEKNSLRKAGKAKTSLTLPISFKRETVVEHSGSNIVTLDLPFVNILDINVYKVLRKKDVSQLVSSETSCLGLPGPRSEPI